MGRPQRGRGSPTPPSARRAGDRSALAEQVRALITEATRPAAKNPELATIVLLAAITGMRRGSSCGLQWRDVEWENAAILVARSVWQTPDGIGTKSPKSHQSRRLLLGDQAMVVLKARQARAEDDATVAGVALSSDSFIFSSDPDGARPLLPDSISQAFDRLCRRLEPPALTELHKSNPKATRTDLAPGEQWPFRFHDLRHYTGHPALR